MSSRTAVTGKVGESSNESDVQTEESSLRNLIFTRKRIETEKFLRTSPDGRYLFYISSCGSSVKVIDTLFKKKKVSYKTHFSTIISLLFRILNFDFSAATINGQPLKGSFTVINYYAFDLENSLVFFHNPFYGCRVATGVLNLEQSTIVIGQSTVISGSLLSSKSPFFPKSYPANLKDGFILEVAKRWGRDYFNVKLNDQNQLQATKINSLSNVNFVVVDKEFAYSLGWASKLDGTQFKGPHIELSKRSLETGELSSYPTINWKAHHHLVFTLGCRVGKQFFGYRNDYARTPKSKIVSLNLDTLEWKDTEIELHGHVQRMTTDGDHTLIIFTNEYDGYDYYYRFVVNKPYSLSNYVWHNLQSIVNSRPDVYDFICSKLPTKIRPPRPIKHSVPLDS
ncbi:hypothetical protein M3Y94_00409900 [Aphelenchoides besseyi]|nr:hypothetical protein M3Y94_00409900 [Aphelenchoides besseyi]